MSKIKVVLNNQTDFEIVFLVGESSYTIRANQSTKITVPKQTSIEARPQILGVNSSFIAGGLKRDTVLDCKIDESKNGFKCKLVLNPLRLRQRKKYI